jgi:hypothetical protein
MKLAGLTETCLNETYTRTCTSEHLSDTFIIQNGIKQADSQMQLFIHMDLKQDISTSTGYVWLMTQTSSKMQ